MTTTPDPQAALRQRLAERKAELGPTTAPTTPPTLPPTHRSAGPYSRIAARRSEAPRTSGIVGKF